MKRISFLLAAALLVLSARAQAEETPAAPAAAPTVHQTLIDAKAGSIVSVKMVIAVSGSIQGQ